ncbi:MAG: hypothetical protein C4523_12030 [Myxococcales bacterium]|nr:MAG: hypothetical protein C4523_12030 [Myxococcales bacterium]
MKNLSVFSVPLILPLAVFLLAACGHDDMMDGGDVERYGAALDEGMTSLDGKAARHYDEAVKLPDVPTAVDLEGVHLPDMMGAMNDMDGMMDGMMGCCQGGEGEGPMREMMGDVSQMRDEMERHEEAIGNCKDMDEVRAEEEDHLERMNGMMDAMKGHKDEMMSGTDPNASCSMMGDGGMMGN